jgi:hypothetical protein
MKLVLVSLALAMTLLGCAGGPVGWGGTHEVLQSNDKFVTYRYDPIVGGRSAAENAATAHCSSYGKTAQPTMRGNEGILQIQTYECRSTQGFASNAEAQSNQIASKMKAGFEATSQCTKESVSSPVGQQITSSILVMSDEQANKYDLFSSKARLNDQQKKNLKEFLVAQNKCRKIMQDAASGTPYAAAFTKIYSDSDMVFTKLLTGQISIGEANLTREQLRGKRNEELAAVAKSLDAQFKNSHNSEVAQDDENRRRLAEAYRANQQAQQQQQVINQNQQLINNQTLQNMKPPAPRTPIQTNCYSLGNSVSCTTQ